MNSNENSNPTGNLWGSAFAERQGQPPTLDEFVDIGVSCDSGVSLLVGQLAGGQVWVMSL